MRVLGLHAARASAALGLSLFAVARAAAAQMVPPVDTRTWEPSLDPQAGLLLEPVRTPGSWQWNVGAFLDYAHAPVDTLIEPGAVPLRVRDQVGADAVANVGIGRRFSVGLDVPFFWQEGTATFTGVGVGDVRWAGKITVLSNERRGIPSGPGLAAVATLSLPTAARATLAGDGEVTGSLRLLAEYAAGVAAVRASLGLLVRPETRTWALPSGPLVFGQEIPWSLGFSLQPEAIAPALDPGDRQGWELALHGSLPAWPVAPFGIGRPGASDLSPVSLGLSDRIAVGHDRDAFVMLGVDVALDSSIGQPVGLRGVVSVGWAPRPHDRDLDGVPDDRDECPDLPEDKDGIQDDDGCPEDDADSDGVLDPDDACPLVPGAPSSDPKRNGCPGSPSAPARAGR
ncbi:MAG: hypothetical protein ABSC94_11220 [Polyangiaceae bacterium]|jgi:hypothetical protein